MAAIGCSTERTQATIVGTASVNRSGTHEFEIEVTDAGEPGTSDTYRIRMPDVMYDSGTHMLEGGDVQIHWKDAGTRRSL